MKTDQMGFLMMNRTAVILIFALIVMFVLGVWVLVSLLLQARRDAAVEKLVLTRTSAPGAEASGGEEALVQRVQEIRGKTRERQVLVACLAVLLLAAAVVGYLAASAFSTISGI